MKSKRKHFFGIMLSLVLTVGMMLVLGLSQTAYAAAEEWSTDQTINSDKEINGGVEVTGDVTVTIAENVTLTVNGGISAVGNTLTVEGKGNLKVTGSNGFPGGTGGDGGAGGNGIVAGKLIINGAKVNIDGGAGGKGGAGGAGVEGTVTVNSGSITVNGGNGGEAGWGGWGDAGYIGGAGGDGGAGGAGVEDTVTVNGGSITVNGGEGGSGGIGAQGTPGGKGGVGGTGVAGTVTVSIGSATVTGGGGGGGRGGDANNGIAASGALSGQTVQEKNAESDNWNVIASGNTSEKRYVKIEADGYPLWVGGVQVTNLNKDNVLKGDPVNDGKVSYTPATGDTPATLTLNGANIDGDTHGSKEYIYNDPDYGEVHSTIFGTILTTLSDLTINVTADSTVIGPSNGEKPYSHGIYSRNNLTINGDGTLNASGGSYGYNSGVCADNIVIDGKVYATGVKPTKDDAIDSGIQATNSITINEGAELTSTGAGRRGAAFDGDMSATLKNAIVGIGWTDAEGTEGKTIIEVNTTGQSVSSLSRFKKAKFPAKADPEPTPKKPQTVGKTTARNTIANSAKKIYDVLYNAVPGATGYDIAYKHKNSSKWVIKKAGKRTRVTIGGISIKGFYQIKVRAKKAETAKYKAATGAWSPTLYRYFHTTEKIRLASKAKRSFTMSWKKNPQATSYQVMFSTKKNGAGAAKNINTVGKNATSFTKTGLKSGKTYYVQVREIVKIGGVNYIGNISCPVPVKVK